MMEKAEAIRCRRFEQLLNEQFGFLDKEKLRIDFLEYFRKKCFKKYQKWKIVYQHFYDFATVHLPSQKSMRTSARSFRLTFLKVAVVTVARASSPTIQSLVTLLYDAKLKTGCIKMLYSIKFHNEPENFLTGLPRSRLS